MEVQKHNTKGRFGLRLDVIAMVAATAFAAIREFASKTTKPGGATPKPGPTEPYITVTDLRARSSIAVHSMLKALRPWPEAHKAIQDCLHILFNPKPEEVRVP